MVPEGWELIKLIDIIKLSSGDTKPKDISKTPTDSKPYPVYGGNNIMGYSSRTNSTKPVILIGRVGEYCGITRYINKNCWITDNALYSKEVNKSIDIEFLALKLKSYDLSRLRNKGGQPLISQKPIYGLKLSIPPFSEQKKIAQILSTWDKAITTTEQLLANSQQQKKALMQQLLTGKKRLLDENGVRFSGEWQESLLGELATITTGSSNRQDSSLTGEYTFFDRSIDVRTSNNYLFDAEAIIVPGEGQQFTPKYFSGKFDLHQRTYAIMDFPSCSGKFLYYYLSHYKQYLLSQAVGSTVKSLRLPMFKKMKLNIPPIDEQHKIAKMLSNADLGCNLLIGKLEHLKKEKKALMQQLLTGKRRVKVDEEAA
ncbi:restriction endonuclease subunit S [Idiomarina sp. OXR-189]|uniref:restriction endonuclease subunit S n=1 Tax=Idiomarina sp. OXR-189 TaxID=3100175 RepID=UPI002AC8CCAF|nr:restriction endonuclease subunit S [Idiomarina sp. OXR-189]WPZ00145.1 restriction endonuclease subunit S [Idiomarina sp. OXR-189]